MAEKKSSSMDIGDVDMEIPAVFPGKIDQLNRVLRPDVQKKLGRPKHSPDREDDARLTIKLPAELHKRLRVHAAYNNVPIKDLVIEAIIEFFKQRGKTP
jgi:hypothetical protein